MNTKLISVLLAFELAAPMTTHAVEELKLSVGTPTLYGRVNKHVVYTNQTDDTQKHFTSERGVDNAESRLGVKGDGTLSQINLKVDYNLELGINSTFMTSEKTNDPASNERIRIRHSKISLSSDYGKFTIGQTTPPIGQRTIKLDPLDDGVASMCNLGQRNLYTNSYRIGRGGFGTYWRARPDLLSYQSPKFHGLSYAFSTDRDQTPSTDPDRDGNYGKANYEHLISYDFAKGNFNIGVFGAYVSAPSANIKHDYDALVGALIGYKNYKMGLSYLQSQKENDANQKQDIVKMLATLQATYGKHIIAATYNYADDKNVISGEDQRQTQYALGYKYMLFKNFKLITTAIKWDYKNMLDSTEDNSVFAMSQGFEVRF